MIEHQVFLTDLLIDGAGSEAIHDAAVIIYGDRIQYAGSRQHADIPDEATVYQTAGMTIMPGLIDCHDHLAHTGLDLVRRAGMPTSLVIYETAQVLEQTLQAGITAVRDAAGLDLGAKLAVETGIIQGPRLVITLSILCPMAGLGWWGFPSGLTFPDEPGIPNGVRNGVDACRLGVREMVAAGADVIKMATTGGISSFFTGPLDRQFTHEEIAAIIDEAHAWNKPTMCHAYGGDGARAAIEAGVDTIEHGSFLHQDDDLLRKMADEGIWLVPTLSVTEAHRTRGNATQRERAPEVMEHTRITLERAYALGVRVAMGTDAGAYGHGENAREIRLLVEAGLTPMQALVASTGDAAACIGLGDEIGTLEPGKRADIIVVDGDPLTEIGLLEDKNRIKLVLKDGQIVANRLVETEYQVNATSAL